MGSTQFPELPTDSPVYAIGYARVSDRSQKMEGASLETQAAAIRKFAARNGWIVLDVIEEVGSGYYLRERKQLSEKVRPLVRERKVHVVIVNSLDRLSREPIHQAVLLNEMIENNVRLESVTEQLDNSPLGNFLRQALAFAAAIEREKILERSARGTQNRVEKGQMIGVGVARYGFAWGDEKHTHYIINPLEAAVVREIYDRYVNQNQSMRKITEWLIDQDYPTRQKGRNGKPGRWCITSVKRILSSETYRGKGFNRTIKWEFKDGHKKALPHPNPTELPDGVIPRIVSDAIWFAAQEKRKRAKAEAPRRNKEPEATLLRSGFIHCGYCGHAMTVVRYYRPQTRNGKKVPPPHYRCGSQAHGAHTCAYRPVISVNIIDQIAWSFVKTLLDKLERIKAVLQVPLQNTGEAELQSIDNLIEATKAEQTRLISDMNGLRGYARSLVLEKLNQLEDKLEGLNKLRLEAVPNAKKAASLQQEVDTFLEWCVSFKGRYDEASYEEKRRAIRMLGIKVHIYRKHDAEHKQYIILAKPEIMKRLLRRQRTRKAADIQENEPDCVSMCSQMAILYPRATSFPT